MVPGMKNSLITRVALAVSALLLFATASPCAAPGDSTTTTTMKLLEVRKIWDSGRHNAFTDLIQFRGRLLCTFREAGGHVPANHGEDGNARVLESTDGTTWTSAALLSYKGIDLRDPKLSITPDGRVMLLVAGSNYENRRLIGRRCYAAFSSDGREFGELKPISIDPKISDSTDWLWRVTWHDKTAYGIVYNSSGGKERVHLVSSPDGTSFTLVKTFDLEDFPNESAVAFLPGGDMVTAVRRDGENAVGMFGRAAPPFTEWTWKEMNTRIGGPVLCMLPDATLLLGTREYGKAVKTVLGVLSLDGRFNKAIEFPSSGDTSYPGLVLDGKTLWMSYYSSHEGKTSIYLAKIALDSSK